MDNEESPPEAVNVSADQVSYVAPSPQVVEDGLLVSILVLDVQGVSDRFRSSQYLGSVSFRHRRDEIRNLLFFPEKLVRAAIISRQNYLQTQVNETKNTYKIPKILKKLNYKSKSQIKKHVII